MAEQTYRVTVRGQFDRADEDALARLRAAADEHDPLSAAFTEAGTLTYDRDARFFTFRMQVTTTAEDGERAAVEQARRGATEAVAALGSGHGDLRVSTVDMGGIRVRRRGR